MTDLINRQDAINAIKDWGLIDGLSEGEAIEILEDIEKVPSAQQWIPCSERLPEAGNFVLGTESDGIVDTWVLQKSFTGKYYWTDSFEERAFDLETVIAWMSLPKPYESGGDNE